MCIRDSAFAADADADTLHVINLLTREVRTVDLLPGDDPGRIAEDASGKIHVVLRGSGELLTVDVATLTTTRRSVCVEPRGVAHSPITDTVLVACRGGALLTIPAPGGGVISTVTLPDDLRDVVVDGDRVLVSRFRSAEILVVRAGVHTETLLPGRPEINAAAPDVGFMEPSVAWRMAPIPGGGAVVVHQRASTAPVRERSPGAYGGETAQEPCGHTAAVESVVSILLPGGGWASPMGTMIPGAALAVDAAVDDAAAGVALVVLAGNARIPGQPTVLHQWVEAMGECQFPGTSTEQGTPVAAAISPVHGGLVQTQDPPMLTMTQFGGVIALGESRGPDTGHQVFHANAGAGVACASCHPEGGDDGRVWLIGEERRRTPGLRFGLEGTAPFHCCLLYTSDAADE